MLLSVTLTCLVALAAATLLLLALGSRLRIASRLLGTLLAAGMAVGAGEAAGDLFGLPFGHAQAGQALLFASIVIVVWSRRHWNPVGQIFFGTYVASALSYLLFAGQITFFGGLAPAAVAASSLLFLLEIFALTISGSFTLESIDVTCRVRLTRDMPDPDPSYTPMVSLHIAAYNEPPDMLIQTIRSVEAIDYPDLEIVVIDNNTEDTGVWRPVEEYCRGRSRVKFVHVENLEGFKSGALNLVMRQHADPAAEIVGVIDADYLVRPDYLRETVGHFADPGLAFVQTPQDYREYEGDTYLTACYDAYKYFFTTSMPFRNERNSIIFAGTMGLIRRSVLEELGGWDEWCITEDAEASLRMLRRGHEGVFVARSFGQGIMPLTFGALKRQRFRWCFGGIQILKKHWRDLLPWRRDPTNRLTTAQRIDYLMGGVQWLVDLVNLGFTLVLLVAAALLLTRGTVAFRPLLGVAVMLPTALIATGLLRALWALRLRTGIGTRRAILAFANWLSMSWTVALACLAGLVKKEGVFLRTPKFKGKGKAIEALSEVKAETLLAAAMFGSAAALAASRKASPFLLAVFAWQGMVYAASPFMSLLNVRTRLSEELEGRRSTEHLRERSRVRPLFVGATALVAAEALAIAALLALGGIQPPSPVEPFEVPRREPGDRGPLSRITRGLDVRLPAINPEVPPEPASSPEPSPSPSPSPAASPSPTTSPSPTASPSPSPSPTASPSPRPSPSPSPFPSPSPSPSPSPTASP